LGQWELAGQYGNNGRNFAFARRNPITGIGLKYGVDVGRSRFNRG
jgi:hypothetical protein